MGSLARLERCAYVLSSVRVADYQVAVAPNPLKLKVDPQAWHQLKWLCAYPFILVSGAYYLTMLWALLNGQHVDLNDLSNVRAPLVVGLGGLILWL